MAFLDSDVDRALMDLEGIQSSKEPPPVGKSSAVKKVGKSKEARKSEALEEELAEVRLIELCENSPAVREVLRATNATAIQKRVAYKHLETKMAVSQYITFNTVKIAKKLKSWKNELQTKLGMGDMEELLTEQDKQLMQIFDMKASSASITPRYLLDTRTVSPDFGSADKSNTSETDSSPFHPQDDDLSVDGLGDLLKKNQGKRGEKELGKHPSISDEDSSTGELEVKGKHALSESSDSLVDTRSVKTAQKRSGGCEKKPKGFAGSCPPAKKAKISIDDVAEKMIAAQNEVAEKLINSQKEAQQAAHEVAKEENRLAREHEAAMLSQILGALKPQQAQFQPYFPNPMHFYPGHGQRGPQFPSPDGGNGSGLFPKH